MTKMVDVDVAVEELRPYREVDVVVLTALAEEKAAVLAAVDEANCEVIRRAGEDVHIARVEAFRIAVASLHGMGNVGASATTREVIEVWRPRFLVLVGIAAGTRGYVKDLRLGDVLVADQVVGFELAKVTEDGLQRRYQTFPPHFDLLAAARSVAASEWTSTIATPRPDGPGAPRVHVGTVLSGEKVFADIASVQELGRVWPTAVGVEMEGLGVAIAAHRGGCGFLLVKGVSDFADASKDDRWRGYAAEAAAWFALAVLRRQPAKPTRASGDGTWPRQLPREATWFTGRAAELERLLTMVSDTQPGWTGAAVVISAIDGMAGIGKTALAVHAAHRLAWQFPDGQLFVDLHGFTAGVARVEPAEALERLLRDVGVPGERIPVSLDERAALWRSALAGRRMLIVLDNAATEAQVQPLLPGAAGCLVLVTSRRRLTALEASRVIELDALPEDDAVLLFARAADRPELGACTQDTLKVVQLCGRLPLAVRIAASRLKHRRAWTVADVVGRLRDLGARLATLDDGQRSVHATLHLSYQHLSAESQRLYRLLGMHPGPDIDRYVATALTGAGLEEVSRLLDGLVDDHLLAEPTVGRYRFHDLVRAHAADTALREETPADRQAALDRLFDYYRHAAATAMDIAHPYERQRRPPVPPSSSPAPDLSVRNLANRWLDSELANLLAVAQHAAKNGRPEHIWQLSATLYRHLRTRGRHRDAETLHQQALNLARFLGNSQAEVDALNGLGYFHWLKGSYEQASNHFGRSLRIAQDIGYRGGELYALTGIGHTLRLLGRYEQAASHFEQALERAQDIGHRGGEVDALTGLGHIHRMHSRYEQAREHYERALDIAQDIDHLGGEVDALIGIGHVYRLLGRNEQAASHFGQALQNAQISGYRNGELQALNGLGHIHRMHSRYEQAREHYERASDIAQANGHRGGELNALIGIGHIDRMLGRHNEAAGHYQLAFDLARDLDSGNWQYEALQGLGRLHHLTGRPYLALIFHQLALQRAIDLVQPSDQARAHDGLAHSHHTLNQHGRAQKHWQHALDILVALGTDHTEDIEASVPNIRSHLASLIQRRTTNSN